MYALMVHGMDRKQRDEFDSTLNTGMNTGTWQRVEGQAWDRLASGEFDRGTSLAEQDIGDQ